MEVSRGFARAAGNVVIFWVAAGVVAAQTLEERLLKEPRGPLAAAARRDGDPARGAAVFFSRQLACSTCHAVDDRDDGIGPNLAAVDPKTTDESLVESLLEPSKVIAPRYATVTVETDDGRVVSGLPVEDSAERLVLRDAARPDKLVTIAKASIVERRQTTQSIMPAAQVNQLAGRQQFLDLVRYLLELRDGGPKRARELQPPPAALGQELPEQPLARQPFVRRGEVELPGGVKFPHAVAIGFVGGTILFDANRLGVAAAWAEGFIKPQPQPYFGQAWKQIGVAVDTFPLDPHPLEFELPGTPGWQRFEPAATSDPNVGTRFDGHQLGTKAVRVHYRVLVGGKRIGVSETFAAESRPDWHGHVRAMRFSGLPAGARVRLALPIAAEPIPHDAGGTRLAEAEGDAASSVLLTAAGSRPHVLRLAVPGGSWAAAPVPSGKGGWHVHVTTGAARAGEAVELRADRWTAVGDRTAPSAGDLAALVSRSPVLDDAFERPVAPPQPLPELPAGAVAAATNPAVKPRPAVAPGENIDDFPVETGRFLRFTVTRTNDDLEPGIDELEVWGPDAKESLAPRGKATASSVITGHAIHRIEHLNDGAIGNEHSWISGERGKGWAAIEFPEPVQMSRVVWGRDRSGRWKDRLPVAYRIEVSPDGTKWKKVADESGRDGLPPAGPAIPAKVALGGYVMEAIPMPFRACRPSDIAFAEDGTLYLIAMTEGQVWRTRLPPPGEPERVTWQRFATGLCHPIGIQVVDGRVYVAQKPEITELIDRDGDGSADHYRTVATGWGLSTGWHEYCFGLAVDGGKNLWVALNTGNFWTHPGLVNLGRWRGAILRVEHGSERLEAVATGCRTPNGIARGPGNGVYFTDNQGDWIAACKLARVEPGRFYGHPERREDALAEGKYPDGLSTVWLPYGLSKSSSGPVWDATGGAFGPFADQLFIGDVGYGANTGILRMALEPVGGTWQGACFPFIEGQPAGCERMKFGPDGQLYMACMTTGLARMRFAGATPAAIHSLSIRPRGAGFTAVFTKPLAADVALDPARCKVRRYHYVYSGQYGSPEAGTTPVEVTALKLSADGKQLSIDVPVEAHPFGMVHAFEFGNLRFADGDTLPANRAMAWYTVQRIPPD
jgi:putative heme-binding domain-containing protein